MPTAYKVDFFPAQSDFHWAQLERATPISIAADGESVECMVVSAEDMVLAKLVWLKEGGGTSEVQRRDIANLLRSNPQLNSEYVDRWAQVLRVEALLDQIRGALRQAPPSKESHINNP